MNGNRKDKNSNGGHPQDIREEKIGNWFEIYWGKTYYSNMTHMEHHTQTPMWINILNTNRTETKHVMRNRWSVCPNLVDAGRLMDQEAKRHVGSCCHFVITLCLITLIDTGSHYTNKGSDYIALLFSVWFHFISVGEPNCPLFQKKMH